MTDIIPAISERVRAIEGSLLERLEVEIEEDFLAFVRVGVNLKDIRDKRLYETQMEPPLNDFKEYCLMRWGHSLRHAYYQINGACIAGYLGKAKQLNDSSILPLAETQVRPLAKLGTERKPAKDKWGAAWSKAIEKANGSPVTEKLVVSVVDEMLKAGIETDSFPVTKWVGGMDVNDIYLADVTSKDFWHSIPEASIDFIITDPPYAPDENGGYSLYEALGRLAARVLKPGRFCAVYMGKMDLPILLGIMGAWLDYEWMFSVYRPKGNWNFRKGQFKECWRPVGIFRKPGERPKTTYYPDSIEGAYEKKHHEWQQELGPIELLVKKYTAKDSLVLEPFCGGGTVPVACVQNERRFLAFDNDETAIRASKERLNDLGNEM